MRFFIVCSKKCQRFSCAVGPLSLSSTRYAISQMFYIGGVLVSKMPPPVVLAHWLYNNPRWGAPGDCSYAARNVRAYCSTIYARDFPFIRRRALRGLRYGESVMAGDDLGCYEYPTTEHTQDCRSDLWRQLRFARCYRSCSLSLQRTSSMRHSCCGRPLRRTH